MSTILSASGDSAIVIDFDMTRTQGCAAIIKPRSATGLSDWIFVTVSGTVPDKSLDHLVVDFTSRSATIKTVAVHDGTTKVLEEGDLGKGETFNIPMSSRNVHFTGEGITVSIEVEFEMVRAWLSLSSVSLAFW